MPSTTRLRWPTMAAPASSSPSSLWTPSTVLTASVWTGRPTAPRMSRGGAQRKVRSLRPATIRPAVKRLRSSSRHGSPHHNSPRHGFAAAQLRCRFFEGQTDFESSDHARLLSPLPDLHFRSRECAPAAVNGACWRVTDIAGASHFATDQYCGPPCKPCGANPVAIAHDVVNYGNRCCAAKYGIPIPCLA